MLNCTTHLYLLYFFNYFSKPEDNKHNNKTQADKQTDHIDISVNGNFLYFTHQPQPHCILCNDKETKYNITIS